MLSESPSGSLSLANTLIVTAVAACVVALSATATGAVFGGGCTVTETVAVAVPPRPSLMV